MKRCGECTRKFPDHLIQAMVTNRGTVEGCPLCLLELRNELHGLPKDTPFQGEIASAMWDEGSEFIRRTQRRAGRIRAATRVVGRMGTK